MITLTRLQARVLRGVFRRSALGIAHRGSIPPLVLVADDGQVRARHRYGPLAVEHVVASAWPSSGSVALPLEALADLEGRDDATVALEARGPDRTVARWSERGIPRSREYPVPSTGGPASFPGPPPSWADVPGGLLDALAEATATAAEDDRRYALGCLALRGATGSIAATDGRQVLVRGGFDFPWAGDVLVRRSPLFARRELPRDLSVSIGKTEAHVVIRVGPWTLWLEIQSGLRFPDVDRILPGPGEAVTRLRLDPGDARFLLDALGRLPGADGPNAPATVDLNGKIAVRARADLEGPATELVLSRSAYAGPPIRLQANREYLARAIRLGFAEVEVVDATTPLVCRDGHRAYAWQPLDAGSAVEPSEDVTRIDSNHQTPASPDPGTPPRTPGPMNLRNKSDEPSRPTVAPTDGHPGPIPDPASTGLVALIREAEALHEALGEARTRSQKLIVALRRHRKQARLMAATLNTLRQLRLQEVAG